MCIFFHFFSLYPFFQFHCSVSLFSSLFKSSVIIIQTFLGKTSFSSFSVCSYFDQCLYFLHLRKRNCLQKVTLYSKKGVCLYIIYKERACARAHIRRSRVLKKVRNTRQSLGKVSVRSYNLTFLHSYTPHVFVYARKIVFLVFLRSFSAVYRYKYSIIKYIINYISIYYIYYTLPPTCTHTPPYVVRL